MKRTFTHAALAAALLLGLSQAAYANGINSPSGVNVEIGAGGTPNIITVTGAGQVGINNPSPAAGYALDVNGSTNIGGTINMGGSMKIYGQGADVLLFGYNPGHTFWSGKEAVLTVADGAGTDNDGIWIGPNTTAVVGAISLTAKTIYAAGNVGIGTQTPQAALDVTGEARVGSMGTPCTSANAGAIRWNGTAFEGCDGSAWGSLIAHKVPDVQTRTTTFPYDSNLHFLDCPPEYVSTGCVSISSPAGVYSCDTSSGTDPNTGLSACVQAGCVNTSPGDTGYFTSTSCIKF